MQAVYAFIVVLCLREVFLGSHSFFINLPTTISTGITVKSVIIILLIINIVFLGMRFFWVPRNLRRNIAALANAKDDGQPDLSVLPDWCIFINWFVIIIHSILFFLLCTEFEFVVFSFSSSATVSQSVFSGYAYLHIALLTINGLWVGMLTSQERRLRNPNQVAGESTYVTVGAFWSRSNLVFSLATLAPFAVASNCEPSMLRCLAGLNLTGDWVGEFLPTSPLGLSAIYDFVHWLVTISGFQGTYFAILWVLVLLMVNSIIDMLSTAKDYILFEEIEWEK